MITVGLIRELDYLSRMLSTPVDVILTSLVCNPIHIKVNLGVLDIEYCDKHIWHEEIESSVNMFGVESCDTISRIITCLDNGDVTNAERMFYLDKPPFSLDKSPTPS
jgi:hypothetical protein